MLSNGPIGVSGSTLIPFAYNTTTNSYPSNVRVANDVQVVTVAANTAQAGAVAVITPSDQDSLIGGHQVILGAGVKTDITIEVTAEDGTTTETYRVTIYRTRTQPSTDATLSALSLSDVTLSPAFVSARREYIGSTTISAELTTLSYTADVGARMVDIQDNSGTGGAAGDPIPDADRTAPGHQVRLNPAGQATVIYVTVTSGGHGRRRHHDGIQNHSLPRRRGQLGRYVASPHPEWHYAESGI